MYAKTKPFKLHVLVYTFPSCLYNWNKREATFQNIIRFA